MKYLVLGGNGFIGSHVVDELIARNEDVTSFGLGKAASNSHRYIHVDGNFLDTFLLEKIISGKDVVIHSLSTTVPLSASENPVWDIESNLVGTIKLVEIMASSKVKKLVYLSSGGTVYGNPKNNPVKEFSSLEPFSTYGVTKVAIESHIKVLCKKFGIELVILRPSNPYGVRQNGSGLQGLISTALNHAVQRKPLTVFGDGETVRDYLYVSDLAKLIVQASRNSVTGIFNAGSGLGYSVNQVLSEVEAVTELDIIKEYKPRRAFDVNKIILDSSKAQRELSWNCDVGLHQGIKIQYEWLRESIW
ncbi:NAD-dependent epimerase/dehydratase family protein [Photobacterium alginatilyticum]|uniref:NAD-dependent epimerase/dehydratase family protein n=1 Tax=Photobacterium alginatilyticum TaxID=1775171 RepID=UPI0040691B86